MRTYFVQIPCFVSLDRPNRTATPDRVLAIEVRAESGQEAMKLIEEAFNNLVNNREQP